MANEHHEDDIIGFLIGLALGLATGSVLALLFAPKKGSELRNDIQIVVKDLPDKVRNEIENPDATTRGFIDKTRINVEGKVKKVENAMQANKMAAAKRREELASGGYEYN